MRSRVDRHRANCVSSPEQFSARRRSRALPNLDSWLAMFSVSVWALNQVRCLNPSRVGVWLTWFKADWMWSTFDRRVDNPRICSKVLRWRRKLGSGTEGAEELALFHSTCGNTRTQGLSTGNYSLIAEILVLHSCGCRRDYSTAGKLSSHISFAARTAGSTSGYLWAPEMSGSSRQNERHETVKTSFPAWNPL